MYSVPPLLSFSHSALLQHSPLTSKCGHSILIFTIAMSAAAKTKFKDLTPLKTLAKASGSCSAQVSPGVSRTLFKDYILQI